MSSIIRRTSAIGFAIVAVVLLALGGLSYGTARRYTDANQSVAHTYQVLSALEQVLTAMVDAETGARGYSDTLVDRYLEPFERANGEVTSRVGAVATLTADNPAQERHVNDLRRDVVETMRLLQDIVSRARSHEPISLGLRDREKATMDALRATLQQMRAEEERLMQQRSANAATAQARTQTLIVALIGVAFAVLAVSFLLVDRRAVQLRRANEQLAERVRERTAALERTLADERIARQETQHAKDAADAANRSKDLFLARVSHELRTPLNALMGWTRMAREGALAPESVQRALGTIDRTAEVLNKLVEDLIDMARMSTGKLQLDRRPVDVAAIARESVGLLLPAAAAKHVQLEMNVEDQPTAIDGDATRLRQVLWNLLSNAIKFTPANGTVTLSIQTGDDGVEITVADTGQGIAAEFLPHVFEPFAQEDVRGHGLGLGLAIVYQLVRAHDGRINVTSPGLGAGTTFTISLPAVGVSESV
jgi:signal transduction histidine kinase